MDVVTVLNAARMLGIEAASVVSGAVNGAGHLILTKHDGTTVDAGYVVGPAGAAGAPGAPGAPGVSPSLGVWANFALVLGGLGAMTVTPGAHPDNHSRYLAMGKVCFFSFSQLYTFGGTIGQSFTVNLPVNRPQPGNDVGIGDVQNAIARALIQPTSVLLGATHQPWVAGTFHARFNGAYEIA